MKVDLTHLLRSWSTKYTRVGLKLEAEGDPKYKPAVWYKPSDMDYVKKRVEGGYGYTYGKRVYSSQLLPKNSQRQ